RPSTAFSGTTKDLLSRRFLLLSFCWSFPFRRGLSFHGSLACGRSLSGGLFLILPELLAQQAIDRVLELCVRDFKLSFFPQRRKLIHVLVADDQRTDLILHLLEGRRRLHALVFDLDHMPAELGLHRLLGMGPGLHGEGRLAEFGNHRASREISEVSAIRGRAVLGLLLGDLNKVAALVELLDNVLGFLLVLHKN